MRGLSRRQANVLAFALDRQDARRPVVVDRPCALCERPGTSGDPVIIRRGEHLAGHRGCLQVHDDRMYAIETALSNPDAVGTCPAGGQHRYEHLTASQLNDDSGRHFYSGWYCEECGSAAEHDPERGTR